MNNDKIVELVQLFRNNAYTQLTTDFTLEERIWLLEFAANSNNSISTQAEHELFNMFNNGTVDEEEFFNSILTENEAKTVVTKTNSSDIKQICIDKMKEQDKINYVNSLPEEERLDILEQFNYLFSKKVQEEVMNYISDDIKISYLINNNSINKKIILSLSPENQMKFLKLCSEKYSEGRTANVEQTIISNMTTQQQYEVLINVRKELSSDVATQIIKNILEKIKYFTKEQQTKIIDIIVNGEGGILQELVDNIDSFTIESQYHFIKQPLNFSTYQQKRKEILDRIINHNIDILSLEEQKKYISGQNSKELSQESRNKVIENIIKKSSNEELFSLFINKYSGSYVESGLDTKKTIISKLSLEYIFSIYMNNNIKDDEILKQIAIENIKNKIKTFENKEKLIIINNDRIQLNRINECLELFGDEVLDFIYNNQNIRNILLLQKEYYNKIINIFKVSQLDTDKVNTVYNALIQEEFRIKNNDVIVFQANLINSINNENREFIEFAIRELTENLDINKLSKEELFISYIKTKGYTIESLLHSKENLTKLISEIINDAHQNKSDKQFELIGLVCKNYRSVKREKYTESKNDKDVLNYPIRVEKNKIISKVIKELQTEEIMKLFNAITKDSFNETQIELIKNKELLQECIEFRKNPVKNTKLGKNLKTFNTIMEVMFFEGMLNTYATDKEKEIYIPKELGRMSIEILADLDYNKLINNVLFTENYEQLTSLISKYGFLSWNNIFGQLTENIGIEFDEEIPKYFLEYFDIILKRMEAQKKEHKDNRPIQMLDYIVGASSFVYGGELDRILFSEKNYNLLRTNPGDFKGSMTAKERNKKAKEFIAKMYQREYIAIPPINDVLFNNNNTKSLRAMIGDTTSMDNLTYGEETNACIRIGSIGESMFDFALTNENGFHIRFEDPETKEFVARVTGFRNGNTLFLNSLRESISEKYSNSDLCEIAIKLGNKIVEATRDSKYPIDNILISDGLAMKKSPIARVSMDETADKDYVPKIPGTNHDISTDLKNLRSNVIVLATSAKVKPYEDIKLGLEQYEKYNVSRKNITIHSNKKEAADRITQINLINQLLINESMGLVSPLLPEQITYAITGEDWYIYVDHNGEIKSKVLDNLPESKKQMAQQELKKALDTVKIRLNATQTESKEDVYGLEEGNRGRGR